MDVEQLTALMNEMGGAIKQATEQLREVREREYVGEAADGLVTARLCQGQLDVDIHVLAKRRLEREELEQAVVEAVDAAEHQLSEASIVTDLERRSDSDVSDRFAAAFRDAMRQMRGRLGR